MMLRTELSSKTNMNIRHSNLFLPIIKRISSPRCTSMTVSINKPQPEKKKRSRRSSSISSSLISDMKDHVSKVDPEDTKFLTDTFVKRLHQVKTKGDHPILQENKMSLWDYLMSYKDHYGEKAILLDRYTAARIATAIVNNSDARCEESSNDVSIERKTIFIDATGGLCRVTDNLINQCNKTENIFSCYKIFEKDVNFVPALQRARNEYLKSNLRDYSENVISLMNFNAIVADYIQCKLKSEYISEFYDRVVADLPIRPWHLCRPTYTLFMSPTHGTVKYFTMACLDRNESCCNEMSRGRPEFFFVLTARTWSHLTLGTAFDQYIATKLVLTKNVLFNLLFDYTLVEVLPRNAFIPWSKKKKINEGKVIYGFTRKIEEMNGNLYLIKARPKVDLGIIDYYNIENQKSCPPAHFFEYFVNTICQAKMETRFLPLLDKWHPSAALHCVRKGIVPVYMKMGDFFKSKDLENIIPVFNSLLRQKNLALSNFGVMADAYKKGELNYSPKIAKDFGDVSSVSYSANFTTGEESLKSMQQQDELFVEREP